jgi:Sec-independent protein translocase protein TatA
MDLFGIGPLELVLILLIALVVLGPQEMANSSRKLAGLVRKVMRSPTWKQMMTTSRELRDLPTKLVRESGFEDQLNEIKRESAFRIDPGPVKPVSHPTPAELTPPPAPPKVEEKPPEADASGEDIQI